VSVRSKKGKRKFVPFRWLASLPFFQSRFQALDAEASSRKMLPGGFHWRKGARFFSTIGIVTLLIWFVSARVSKYFNWQGTLKENPVVFNLTDAGIQWDVFYGKSPLCGTKECLLQPDTPSSAFQKQMVLPAREFPLKDYKKGDIVYLRTSFRLPDNVRAYDGPISFQSIYVWAKSYVFYINGVPVDEGSAELLNITLPRDVVSRDEPVRIAIRIDPGDLPYQGLAHRGDLFIGPKIVLSQTIYDAQEFKTTYYLWFILPKLTFCLIFAFLFLAISRHRELFSFILFTFVGTLDLFMQSGYAEEMLPRGPNWQLVGLFLRAFSAIIFMRFIHDFYRRKSRNLHRFQLVANISITIFGVLSLTVIPNKIASDGAIVMVAALQVVSLLYALWTSALLWLYLSEGGQSRFRQRSSLFITGFMAVACVAMIPYSTRSVLEVFGVITNFGGFNLAAIFDLAFFLILSAITATEFGLTISAKELSEAKIEVLEDRLELAQTVQQMLLPKKLTEICDTYAYRFHYETAEKMSGDWINIRFDEETGVKHLLFGDVVGKGPQAALAVAAVSSILSDARSRSLTIPESLNSLNRHLKLLFEGHINTTVAAASIHPDGTLELYNCGTIGWFVVTGPKVEFLPLRSAPLGFHDEARIGYKKTVLADDMTIFTFSDGCLEGPRAVKTLTKAIKNDPALAHGDMAELLDMIIEYGRESAKLDDKTAVVVTTNVRSQKQDLAS
jgi:hypothetical protein